VGSKQPQISNFSGQHQGGDDTWKSGEEGEGDAAQERQEVPVVQESYFQVLGKMHGGLSSRFRGSPALTLRPPAFLKLGDQVAYVTDRLLKAGLALHDLGG